MSRYTEPRHVGPLEDPRLGFAGCLVAIGYERCRLFQSHVGHVFAFLFCFFYSVDW